MNVYLGIESYDKYIHTIYTNDINSKLTLSLCTNFKKICQERTLILEEKHKLICICGLSAVKSQIVTFLAVRQVCRLFYAHITNLVPKKVWLNGWSGIVGPIVLSLGLINFNLGIAGENVSMCSKRKDIQ